MSLNNHEKYKLMHNKDWIQTLENKEIDEFSVDYLENQWMLYKDAYTEDPNNEFRMQTSKNRPGDILLRKKNYPYGFKLTATISDIDDTGRQYQASIPNESLRELLDGNCYELKLYDSYGVAFGKVGSDWKSILFKITGKILNSYDEEFVEIRVISIHSVDSLYAFVDAIVYNNIFLTITHSDLTLTVQRYNISSSSDETPATHVIDPSDITDTSTFNDLSGLSYPPIDTRLIPINGTPIDKLGRIWTVEYSESNIFLAYECQVPLERSSVTDVTEGIVLIEADKNTFLNSSTGDFALYVFDTVEDVSKVSRNPLCQAFIPEFDDIRKSFGNSISKNDTELVVGSDREEAVYVYDLGLADTPDIFGAPGSDPILPANGVKIEKDYELESTPIYPIRMQAGELMDFEVFGGTGIVWVKPDGTTETISRPAITLAQDGIIYLIMDSFKDGIKIVANSTAGHIGYLGDVPNIEFGIDLSNTVVSGYFNNGFDATDINIENTQLSQTDLEQCAIVLHEAGNYDGIFNAASGLPTITDVEAIGAINSLRAKGWNILINYEFDDIDPQFNINGTIESGYLSSIQQFNDDLFQIYGETVSGKYESVPSGIY